MRFTEDPRVSDHQSDPAHTPGDGWVEEGGASHLGPATHIASGRVEHDGDGEHSDREHDGEHDDGEHSDGEHDREAGPATE